MCIKKKNCGATLHRDIILGEGWGRPRRERRWTFSGGLVCGRGSVRVWACRRSRSTLRKRHARSRRRRRRLCTMQRSLFRIHHDKRRRRRHQRQRWNTHGRPRPPPDHHGCVAIFARSPSPFRRLAPDVLYYPGMPPWFTRPREFPASASPLRSSYAFFFFLRYGGISLDLRSRLSILFLVLF